MSEPQTNQPETNAPLIVILNPASGSTNEEFRADVERALRERHIEFEIRETKPDLSAGELTEAAVREGAVAIVACGGDGTIMSVVNGLAKSQNFEAIPGGLAPSTDDMQSTLSATPAVTLLIIPGGTANLVATALGIPRDIDEAAAIVVAGDDRIIDLGRCGEHFFALGLGLGLTERLVSQASSQLKERLGKVAYAWAMLRELGARPHNFSFRLDDNHLHRARGVAIVVANSGEVGTGMRFAPRAQMDDGLLDLCVLRRFYFRDLMRLAWHALFGGLQRDRAVSFYQARRIEIRSDPPLDLQIDGETVDLVTPLVVEVLPRALRVRVPAKTKDEG